METHQSQGSFKLLRSFLGTIAGGLSSLASLPFGKRKQPEDSLLTDASPHSPAGFDQVKDDLSKLYPDMELSETRKRARLSLYESFEDTVEYSNSKEDKCHDEKGLMGESSVTGLRETPLGFEGASSRFDAVHYVADEMLGDSDVTAFSSDGVLHASHCETEAQPNLNVSEGPEEAPLDEGEDSDEFLASFRRILVARKAKQQRRVQDSLKEESPKKKVRFGGDNEVSGGRRVHMDMMLKKCTTTTKRKRVDEAEEKNEKKLRALTLSEEPVRPEGRTSTVGMASILTRKRERADDDIAPMKAALEDSKLRKVVFVENFPLNASRKDVTKEFSQFGAIESMHLQLALFQDEKTNTRSKSIRETNKTADSQSARIVYKDELFARAAVAHNMKEFKGNYLRVSAAHAHAAPKEAVSASVDESWGVFVSNTPTDVKDEELYHLFSVVGSLKLDVTSVRVIRDPHTGLSKGTAYVFFKTEADVSHLLSSRRALKLRGRVIRVSRAVASMHAEQQRSQLQASKRLMNPEADVNTSQKKRVKASTVEEGVTATKEFGQTGEQVLTRSRRGTESAKEQIEVQLSASHVYSTRHVATSSSLQGSLEESPEAKRKRVEKHQRGISRSKKIRRT